MENNEQWRDALKDNLAVFRKNKGLTQTELGEKLNYSDKSVSKWERGEGVPDVSVLVRLSDMYSVSVDALLGREKTEEDRPHPMARHTLLLITIACTVLACTLITFLCLNLLLESVENTYLCFIFALPVIFTAMGVCFLVWKKGFWAFGTLSAALWSACVSVYLAAPLQARMVFTVGGIAQTLACIACGIVQLIRRK